MKLSILIPMYNAQDYIGNCIESLLDQNISEDHYEIIIMDDGSIDNSFEIVSKYCNDHQQIKLLKQANAGAYTARNKLLKLAKGDYIYNLDADDYIVKNCLKPLLDLAEEENLDIIGFKTKETTLLSDNVFDGSLTKDHLNVSSGVKFLEQYPHVRHETWWYFIKRESLLEKDLNFSSNQYNADVMFTLKALLSANSVGFIEASLHRYVQTENSIMRSQDSEVSRKRMAYMQMMIIDKSKLINTMKSQNHSEVLIQNLSHRRDVFTFFNLIKMFRSTLPLAYIKDVVQSLKTVDAYPIKDFNNHIYNTLQYRILRKIVNVESIFYSIIALKRLFSKSA